LAGILLHLGEDLVDVDLRCVLVAGDGVSDALAFLRVFLLRSALMAGDVSDVEPAQTVDCAQAASQRAGRRRVRLALHVPLFPFGTSPRRSLRVVRLWIGHRARS